MRLSLEQGQWDKLRASSTFLGGWLPACWQRRCLLCPLAYSWKRMLTGGGRRTDPVWDSPALQSDMPAQSLCVGVFSVRREKLQWQAKHRSKWEPGRVNERRDWTGAVKEKSIFFRHRNERLKFKIGLCNRLELSKENSSSKLKRNRATACSGEIYQAFDTRPAYHLIPTTQRWAAAWCMMEQLNQFSCSAEAKLQEKAENGRLVQGTAFNFLWLWKLLQK